MIMSTIEIVAKMYLLNKILVFVFIGLYALPFDVQATHVFNDFTDYQIGTTRQAKSQGLNSNTSIDDIPKIVHINSNIYGHRVIADLILQTNWLDSNVSVQLINSKNIVKTLNITSHTYHTNLKNGGWAVLTLEPDMSFSGSLYIEKQNYQIHLNSNLNETIYKSTNTKMVIQKVDTNEIFNQTSCTSHAQPLRIHNQTGEFRPAAAVLRWNNCYSTDQTSNQLSVGIAVDFTMYQSFASESLLRSYIANLFAFSSKITLAQFNIQLTMTDLIMYSETGPNTPKWNQRSASAANCGSTIDITLNEFTEWKRADHLNKNAVWILLTNCYRSGTIGLAYIGTLCSQYYNTAVVSKTGTTHFTFIHEISHTLSGEHTFQLGKGKTGSILDYISGPGQGMWPLNSGDVQFSDTYSKAQICSQLNSQVSNKYTQPYCMRPYAPVCGNGIIENNEVCDDTSACCVNCQLAPKAQCSGNSNCCSSTCQFLPTTSTCSKTGFCANGKCQESACSAYSGLTFCGVKPDNTCRQQCQAQTTCSDKYTTPNLAIADGTVCSYNGQISVCKSGVCQPNANPTPPPPSPTPTPPITTVTPPASLSTETLLGIDVLEQNIGAKQVSTEEECRQLLSSLSNSHSVVYKASTKMCYPKLAGINLGVVDASLKVFAKKNVSWILNNIDFMGADLSSYATNDALTCHFQCKTNTACVGVLFYAGRCYFKKGPGITRPLINAKYYVN